MFQERCVPEVNIHVFRLMLQDKCVIVYVSRQVWSRTKHSCNQNTLQDKCVLFTWLRRKEESMKGMSSSRGTSDPKVIIMELKHVAFWAEYSRNRHFICAGVLYRAGFCTIITPGASLCSWTGELTPAPGTGKSSSASLSFIIIIIIFIINTFITCHPASGSSLEADWVQAEIIQMSIQIKPRLISHQEMLKIINTNWHFSLDFFC